jgi:hypothetical protein
MCVYDEAPCIGTASAAVDRLARRVIRESTSGGGWYGPWGTSTHCRQQLAECISMLGSTHTIMGHHSKV